MKVKIKLLLATAMLGTATFLLAQSEPPPPDGPGGPDGPPPGHRPPPPIIATLDTNHDGVIDADEIANAATSLKALDQNGDGKLTPDELHPPRPNGPGPEGPDFGGPGFDGPPPRD